MRSARGSQARKDLPYRSCVGVMLINKDGLVFIGRRRPKPMRPSDGYAWQMPQGGIDPGEEPYQAALRELYEETSVRSVSCWPRLPNGMPTTCRPWSPAAPGGDAIAARTRVVRLPLRGR